MPLRDGANLHPKIRGRHRTKHTELPVVDFSSVGGLTDNLQKLKQSVIFPLLHRNVFMHFDIKPPRGVLFYGPPGTGKTFVAGALANELSKLGLGKISFFYRKGADILDKWLGESERKLRQLFVKAAKCSPAIIFFDELDGLAPKRSTKNEQVHCSVVTTLLAMMDGLDKMPGVVVIGATNRIESVDPALRRPGRFDKELYFPLPCTKSRGEILRVHMRTWKHKPSEELLWQLAELTMGFSGSDIQALCAEAVLCCVKRLYPDVKDYNHIANIKIDLDKLKIEKCDFINGSLNVVPSSQKTDNKVQKLNPFIQPLLQRQLNYVLQQIDILWRHFLQPSSKYLIGHGRYAGRLLLIGTSSQGLNNHLVPAILYAVEHLSAHIVDDPINFTSSLKEARKVMPSVLVLQRLDRWWDHIDSTIQIGITAALEDIHAGMPLLLIVTCCKDLPEMLHDFFYNNSSIIVRLENPDTKEREAFLAPLFTGDSPSSLRNILRGKPAIKRDIEDKRDACKIFKTRGKFSKIRGKTYLNSNYRLRGGGRHYSGEVKAHKRKYISNNNDNKPLIKRIKVHIPAETQNLGTSSCPCATYTNGNRHDPDVSCKRNFTTLLSKILKTNTPNHDVTNGGSFKTLYENRMIKQEAPSATSVTATEIPTYEQELESSGDVAFNLLQKASYITSEGLTVADMELMYDMASVCINVHKNNPNTLVENLNNLLNNWERPVNYQN